MMFLGGLAGSAASALYVGWVLRLEASKILWLAGPLAELCRAWVGARWARRVLGRAATRDQRARMALWYTVSVTCGLGSALLAALLWAPSRAPSVTAAVEVLTGVLSRGPFGVGAIVLAAMAGAVLLRYLLLALFNPRR
jgi:hypothetical protein